MRPIAISIPHVTRLIHEGNTTEAERYPATGYLDLTRYKKALLYAFVRPPEPDNYYITIESALADESEVINSTQIAVAPGATVRVIDLAMILITDGAAKSAICLAPKIAIRGAPDSNYVNARDNVRLLLHLEE